MARAAPQTKDGRLRQVSISVVDLIDGEPLVDSPSTSSVLPSGRVSLEELRHLELVVVSDDLVDLFRGDMRQPAVAHVVVGAVLAQTAG